MVLTLTWKTGKSQEFANFFSRSCKSQEFYIKHEKVGKTPGNFVLSSLNDWNPGKTLEFHFEKSVPAKM